MRLGETGCVEDDVIVVRYPVPPLHLRADSVAYHTSDAVRTDQIARLKGLLVIVLADDPNCNALLILLRACEAGVAAYLDGRKFLHLFKEHCLGLILRYPLGMFDSSHPAQALH